MADRALVHPERLAGFLTESQPAEDTILYGTKTPRTETDHREEVGKFL